MGVTRRAAGRRRVRSEPPTWRSACLTWALRCLPHYLSDAPAPFHDELLTDLESGERLIARVAPRGHAKSTCVSLAYPLWRVCTRSSRNIVIITHEAALATQFVRDLRGELESNERLIEAFGDLLAKPSADAERATARTTRRPRTKLTDSLLITNTGIAVQAKGSGASFRGMRVGPNRPDLIICDDLERDDRVDSPEARQRLEHWLRRVVMPALAPGGQLVVIGSILHYDSLLASLCDRKRWPRWNYRVYRALEAAQLADGAFELQALWPARWSVAALQAERERVGTLAFEQEYQANPIDTSLRVFRPEWLRRWTPPELAACERRLIKLIAVDPATGVSGGDYFALWVGGVDPQDGVMYTLELTLERIGIVDQVQRIVAAFERHRPVRIGIEVTAYQAALRDVLMDYGRASGLLLPVVGISTTANKRARIEGASVFFENGVFRLPPDLSADAEMQFLQFPKARHDDAPDVCVMAIELARSIRCSGNLIAETGAAGPWAGFMLNRRNNVSAEEGRDARADW